MENEYKIHQLICESFGFSLKRHTEWQAHSDGQDSLRKTKKIIDKIKELEQDERLSYPPADVFSNAPLALVQATIKAQLDAYYFALGLEGRKKFSCDYITQKHPSHPYF
jgi:hypothetical protein